MGRMSRFTGARRTLACGILAMTFGVASSLALEPEQTKTVMKAFEIVGVAGNKVVIKDAEGVRELTVPKDFRVDVNGTMVGVGDLKPGMTGSATVTTTTSVKKMYVSEVKQGRITKIVGRNVILMIAGETDYRMLTQEDGGYIFRDGRPLDWETLRVGDVLTATIVTEKEVMKTVKDVKAAVTGTSGPTGSTGPTGPTGPTPGSSIGAAPVTSGASATSGVTGPAPAAPAQTPVEQGGMSPLMIGGIVAALALIGVILLGMRSREEEKQR